MDIPVLYAAWAGVITKPEFCDIAALDERGIVASTGD